MKRFSFIFIFVMTFIMSATISIHAAETEKSSKDYRYTVGNNNEVTINKYIGSDVNVVIPKYINNKKVTKISGKDAFDGASNCENKACANIKSIVMPDTIKEIDDATFWFLPNLEEIKLSQSIEKIGTHFLYRCTKVKKVELPDTVKSIGNYAFGYDTDLEEVVMSKSIEKVGEYFFGRTDQSDYNTNTKVRISHESYTSFKKNLKSEFNNNRVILEYNNFECSIDDKEEITINKYFGRDESIIIPNKISNCLVKAMAEGLFKDCVLLTNITIPSTLKNISDNAFKDCKALESVKASNETSNLKINGSYNMIIGKGAFANCTKLKNVEIIQYANEIKPYAFLNCKSLENLDFYKYIKTIGEGAFANCTKIKKIDIENTTSNVEIGWYAFFNCKSLEYVRLANNYKIESEAFLGCKNIKELYIPEKDLYSQDEIDKTVNSYDAFDNEVQIRFFDKTYNDFIYHISDDVAIIKRYVGNREDVTIPESIEGKTVVCINENAFYKNKNVKSIKMPNTIKYIENNAFYGCSALETIELSNNLLTIKNGAFYGCKSLKNICIPKSVEYIEERDEDISAFDGRYLEKIKVSSELINTEIFDDEFTGNIYYYDNVDLPNVNELTDNEYIVASEVTNVKADSIGFNNILISWDKANVAKGYYIYRSNSKDGEYKKIGFVDNNTIYYMDEKLDTNITYYYKVRAFMSDDTWCDGNDSSIVYVKTKNDKTTIKTVKSDAKNSISINWNEIEGCSGYDIYCSVNDGEYSLIATANSNNYSQINVDDGKVYTYKIRPYIEVEGKKYYGEFSNEYRYVYKLNVVENISLDYNNDQVIIYWDESENADGYIVYHSDSLDGEYEELSVFYEKDITDIIANDETVGFYKIQAFVEDNEECNSDFSEVIVVKK